MKDTQNQRENTLYYESLGAGKPLILLHGFGTNRYTWRHVISEVPDGYKIYVIDFKGFGLSEKPKYQDYSLHDQAALIYDFIVRKSLNDVTIVGHSMGGGIALISAMNLLESGHNLSSLILIDTIAYPQTIPSFISFLRTPIINWITLTLVPPEIQVRLILKLAYYNDDKITEEAVRAYAAPLKEPGGRHALVETAKRIIPNDIETLIRRYSEIHVPTLILWGKQDEIVPLSIGERLHKALPNSKLRILNFSGHAPHEEVPEKAVKLISAFLRDHL